MSSITRLNSKKLIKEHGGRGKSIGNEKKVRSTSGAKHHQGGSKKSIGNRN